MSERLTGLSDNDKAAIGVEFAHEGLLTLIDRQVLAKFKEFQPLLLKRSIFGHLLGRLGLTRHRR